MDTHAAALPANTAAEPDCKPVAVTRWTARLADPQCEQAYRLDRFTSDRRRALMLMGLVAVAGVLNSLVELNAYADGVSRFAALIPAFSSTFLPLLALVIFLHVQTPRMLEGLLVCFIAIGILTRLSMLTLHPGMTGMWPVIMVGLVFVIYLYLPIRFVASVAIATAFSIVAPVWWSYTQGAQLPLDQFYRGLVWLFLANALAFTAGNCLQRSLRTQFAQGLVLQELLSTDSLTGIANRRRFDAAFEQEWRRCGRAGTPLSLLMIDVDHFKSYNDHWGHQRGDDCLRLVARLLVGAAGRPGDLVARYGGEEFVCLLPEVGLVGARAVADWLAAAIEQAAIAHPRSSFGQLTVSIGVATATELSTDPSADLAAERNKLFALSDKLLYAAKNRGRNQVAAGELHSETMLARAA